MTSFRSHTGSRRKDKRGEVLMHMILFVTEILFLSVSWFHTLCDKPFLVCIVFLWSTLSYWPKNTLDEQYNYKRWIQTLFVISQSLWPIDSRVLFRLHILFNWGIICQHSAGGRLTNGLVVYETLLPLSLLAIRISVCIVSYHNVIPGQIPPYKEVHSPFILPCGRINGESHSLLCILNRRVYYRIWEQGCILSITICVYLITYAIVGQLKGAKKTYLLNQPLNKTNTVLH